MNSTTAAAVAAEAVRARALIAMAVMAKRGIGKEKQRCHANRQASQQVMDINGTTVITVGFLTHIFPNVF